jgi:hypothetical protein
MNQQATKELQQSFLDAGWDLDGSFEEYLVIGYSGDGASILAHKEVWGSEDPSSRSSITRGCSLAGLVGRYLPLSRPKNYSRSTDILLKSGRTSFRRTRRLSHP